MEEHLSKLKVKPKPKKKDYQPIIIRNKNEKDIQSKEQTEETKEQEEKTIVLVDKTKENIINRNDFIKKLKDTGKYNIIENEKGTIISNIVDNKKEKEKEPVKRTELVKKTTKTVLKAEKPKEEEINQEMKVSKPDFPISDTINPNIQPLMSYEINDVKIQDRIPPYVKPIIIQRDKYILENRKAFLNFINEIFQPYRRDIINEQDASRTKSDSVDLFTHQKIVRDYINLYTPYRGLLLFHGLGSGKTCTSIGIAEGIIKTSAVAMGESIGTNRKIIVMTPASLRANYFEELKKCGNPIYKKNQHWEFIDTTKFPEHIEPLSKILHLPVTSIESQKGAWMVDVTKKPNYDLLDAKQQKSLEFQLDEMIVSKFKFINYNNPRIKDQLNRETSNHTKNLFDDKVVIIDEAHNFISRIVNTIGPDYKRFKKEERPPSINMYDYLMKAENCRVVLLTGTPIINYPNEIGVIYNILRGYIITYSFTLEYEGGSNINSNKIKKALEPEKSINYMELRKNKLLITRNPFEFVNTPGLNVYKGVKQERNNSDKQPMKNVAYMNHIIKLLAKQNIKVVEKKAESSKALPDKLQEFITEFVDSKEGDMKNQFLFKKRIIGLTSFLNDKEELMPKYEEDDPTYFKKIYVPMSSYMFPIYKEIRKDERSRDTKKGSKSKKGQANAADPSKILFEKSSSSYRVASRSFCNFAFPEEIPRPQIMKKFEESGKEINFELTEDDLDAIEKDERQKNIDGQVDELKEENNTKKDNRRDQIRKEHAKEIKETLVKMEQMKMKYLTQPKLDELSPKFAYMLGNITNEENKGLHMVYSQFRTLEGIGIFSLALEANGYRQFKLKKNTKNNFELDIPDDHEPGKLFALYTGTESVEEKETMRKIYNSEWSQLPVELVKQLKDIHENNFYGEVIKIFMITQSGAEGINLKNTRFVHIMEPYWHPVRTKQVIGRARRINSHNDLPDDLRTVTVFMYLLTFTEEQHKNMPTDLKNDKSKFDKTNTLALTTDETLYEISNKKENINRKIVKAIKESAIDCSLYDHDNEKDPIECHSFGLNLDPKEYAFVPKLQDEDKTDNIAKANQQRKGLLLREVTIDGITYAMRVTKDKKNTYHIYTYESYMAYKKNPKSRLVNIGKVIIKSGQRPYINTEIKDDFKDL